MQTSPKRAKTHDRGYGSRHQRKRKDEQRKVNRGGVSCSRCGGPIVPGEDWHLDHDDDDRKRYRGPSHKKCNIAARNKRYAKKQAVPIVDNLSREW